MKRSWFGFFLLLVLLAGSILVTWVMIRIHEPMEENLLRAAEYALEEDWIRANRFFREAEAGWIKWEHVRACFADHNPVEEIDAALAMLQIYCGDREQLAFAAGCRDLAEKVAAVGKAHEPVWWNFL